MVVARAEAGRAVASLPYNVEQQESQVRRKRGAALLVVLYTLNSTYI